ncbi:Dysbindin domain-containing protein 1 [Bagarius yarrelli]|uniref:Dysbindin domain-containing protein 1 n=1 Tax=Bagarius yarrelli TaxID=175774 RepID=A0A556V8H4_BAGYA|nr:Dysbindin domain-containing protein 1 [Bagarius yarrelli]
MSTGMIYSITPAVLEVKLFNEDKNDQKLQKPSSSSREPTKEPSQNSRDEEDRVIPVHTPSLLHVTDRRREFREPLSSVSSLEVHFDLLDLTELTDMSDQELTEVFVSESEEEIPNSPASYQHPSGRGSYLRSPSWSRCGKPEQSHGRKHHSESDSNESHHKLERLKRP